MKIKEMPILERPYEKLENYGVERLSDAELLAIIIKTGTKELTSVQVSQQLLNLDLEKKGISFLKDISLEEIRKQKGIGRVKSIQLKALGELASRMCNVGPIFHRKVITPEDVSRIFMPELRHLKQEVVKTVLLDTRNNLIRIITNSIGGLNSNYIEAREIFREPIKSSANSIVMVHNHPGGDPSPSNSDINFTRKISDIGNLLGIQLLDHVIIGDGIFCSLKRMNKF